VLISSTVPMTTVVDAGAQVVSISTGFPPRTIPRSGCPRHIRQSHHQPIPALRTAGRGRTLHLAECDVAGSRSHSRCCRQQGPSDRGEHPTGTISVLPGQRTGWRIQYRQG
jgi:hypothetical protein